MLRGRARNRLLRGRENGYLVAACDSRLVSMHSRWCWQLKLPVVWTERNSPRSRYGRVHLDLFTTPYSLTAAGREALQSLRTPCQVALSPHDGHWEHVPVSQLENLARSVFRAVQRRGNFQFELPLPATNPGPAKLLAFRATA